MYEAIVTNDLSDQVFYLKSGPLLSSVTLDWSIVPFLFLSVSFVRGEVAK